MKEFFITAGELAEYLNCKILGDKGKKIYGIALMQDSTENTLTYVMSDKRDRIQHCNAGVILTTASIGLPLYRTYIFTNQEPYYMLNDVICYMMNKGLYCNNENCKTLIADSAVISQNVVIGNGSVIGENCFIGANTVIGDNTIIEDNVYIGTCCSIGTENFEFCKTEHGWSKIRAIGNVRICHDAFIGGNVVIEKATIGTTLIGAYTQIDNLVEVGHECRIGENCHIVACTALAGWSEIGNNVEIYGQAAVSNNVKIGDGAVLLARTGADKNIPENMIVSGFPAREHKTEMRSQAFLRKLYEKSIKKDVK